MKVRMKLLEDAIFGNGQSIPGKEDISLLRDENGFPYYKGGTLKGIFREELERNLSWKKADNGQDVLKRLLGESGSNDSLERGKLIFSDFCISKVVKDKVLEMTQDPVQILDDFSSLRTFTQIGDNGMVKENGLRIARCVNKGISFYGEIQCEQEDENLVLEILKQIRWVGTMRNRGFGRVVFEVV